MLAPIDATVALNGGDNELTLRLNWRALAMAKDEGVNLVSGAVEDELDLAAALRCLAHQDHPEIDNDTALAWILTYPVEVSAAIEELLVKFGAIVEGNRPAPKKKPARKKTSPAKEI